MGLCRPRGPTLTRRSYRAHSGHYRSPLGPSIGSNRQRQRIHRTLSLDEASGRFQKLFGRVCTWRSIRDGENPVRISKIVEKANWDAAQMLEVAEADFELEAGVHVG